MLQVSIAGRVGRDAEVRNAGGTDVCSFSVAADVGFGDKKQTVWIDVSKWGKGADTLAGYIRKGTQIAVTGELSTREHDGKTYIQCRADRVTLMGGGEKGERQQTRKTAPVDDDAGWGTDSGEPPF